MEMPPANIAPARADDGVCHHPAEEHSTTSRLRPEREAHHSALLETTGYLLTHHGQTKTEGQSRAAPRHSCQILQQCSNRISRSHQSLYPQPVNRSNSRAAQSAAAPALSSTKALEDEDLRRRELLQEVERVLRIRERLPTGKLCLA